MDGFIASLRAELTPASVILTPQDSGFVAALARWSHIDLQTPAAVVQPASEEDVSQTVQEAVKAGIPFVPKSGGHSQWATIDSSGIIIDLRLWKGVQVDENQQIAKVSGGLLMKELQIALADKNRWTPVANGNTVGVIPYFIGGGISSYTPLAGYACENILAAKMIAANGETVEASETQNPELLWGIRGAGQFLGLVIELTIRTYDLSRIGPGGIRQIGTMFFPVGRVAEVAQKLRDIVIPGQDHASAGHFMIMKDPSSADRRVVMVAQQYFGAKPEHEATFKPLLDFDPLSHMEMDANFRGHSDHLDWILSTGEYKSFSQTGMATINPDNFAKLADLHQELLDTVPGSERSAFTLEWHTPTPQNEARQTETSFGHKNIDVWLNILTWYTDPQYHEQVEKFSQRAQALMRSDMQEADFVAYTNTSRKDPLDHRYKGPENIEKLKKLKKKWDPSGVFTQELL